VSVSESPTDVALQYVGQQLAAMRTDISNLGAEVRAHVAEQAPRIAVLEHRITEAERDITAIQTERGTERAERDKERAERSAEARRLRVQAYLTLAGCVLAAILAWASKLIGG
jgi:hypothetical protein